MDNRIEWSILKETNNFNLYYRSENKDTKISKVFKDDFLLVRRRLGGVDDKKNIILFLANMIVHLAVYELVDIFTIRYEVENAVHKTVAITRESICSINFESTDQFVVDIINDLVSEVDNFVIFHNNSICFS